MGCKTRLPHHRERFYDLNKDPIVSPYTGEVVALDTGKGRTMVADAADAQSKKLETTAWDDDDVVLDDDDDADVDVDLGDDVLDDDDDDQNVSLDELADVPADDNDAYQSSNTKIT